MSDLDDVSHREATSDEGPSDEYGSDVAALKTVREGKLWTQEARQVLRESAGRPLDPDLLGALQANWRGNSNELIAWIKDKQEDDKVHEKADVDIPETSFALRDVIIGSGQTWAGLAVPENIFAGEHNLGPIIRKIRPSRLAGADPNDRDLIPAFTDKLNRQLARGPAPRLTQEEAFRATQQSICVGFEVSDARPASQASERHWISPLALHRYQKVRRDNIALKCDILGISRGSNHKDPSVLFIDRLFPWVQKHAFHKLSTENGDLPMVMPFCADSNETSAKINFSFDLPRAVTGARSAELTGQVVDELISSTYLRHLPDHIIAEGLQIKKGDKGVSFTRLLASKLDQHQSTETYKNDREGWVATKSIGYAAHQPAKKIATVRLLQGEGTADERKIVQEELAQFAIEHGFANDEALIQVLRRRPLSSKESGIQDSSHAHSDLVQLALVITWRVTGLDRMPTDEEVTATLRYLDRHIVGRNVVPPGARVFTDDFEPLHKEIAATILHLRPLLACATAEAVHAFGQQVAFAPESVPTDAPTSGDVAKTLTAVTTQEFAWWLDIFGRSKYDPLSVLQHRFLQTLASICPGLNMSCNAYNNSAIRTGLSKALVEGLLARVGRG